MPNEDAEPPRLVRPYVTPPAGGPAEPAAAPARGAHRPAARPPVRRPPEPDGPDVAGNGPGDAPPTGARRRRALLIALAAVVALVAGLAAVVLLDRRDRADLTGAAPSALPLPPAPQVPSDDGAPSTQDTAGGSGTPGPSRSPSRSVPVRRSATGAASSAGTPAAANTDGVNLASGRPATASSVEGGNYAPGLAVDGDLGTRWSSAFSDPQWISVDLGRVWLVTRVVLRWEAAYGVDYDLAVSTDGTTWRTVWRTSTGAGGVQDVRIAATPARFVRMNGTRRVGMYGYSLFELEVR